MSKILEMIPGTIRVRRVRAAIDNWKTATVEWAKATLALAEEMYQARQLHGAGHEGDLAFAHWLTNNDLDDFDKNDRAALIKMGEHVEITRRVLEETERTSLQLIWREEIQHRYPSTRKPPSIVTQSEESTETPAISRENEEPANQTDPSGSVEQSGTITNLPVPSSGPPKLSKEQLGKHPLGKLPKAGLVLAHILNSQPRQLLGRIIKKHAGSSIWTMIVNAIESGAFGAPSKACVTKPNLRLLLPWAPIDYANRFDLFDPKDRSKVRDNVLPVVAEQRELLRAEPEKLPFLVQEVFAARVRAADEIRREAVVAKLPAHEQKIIMYGKPVWPSLNDAGFTYDELCCAIWFCDFTRQQFPVNWSPADRSLQTRQMLKWIISKEQGWATAVREICYAYEKNPEAKCEYPPPPVNFGIG